MEHGAEFLGTGELSKSEFREHLKLLLRNKGTTVNFQREHAPPPPSTPWEALTDQPMKLGDYAEGLDSKVKERYREKISPIGIDPFIIPDKNFDPECLPPVESVDLVS